jgi:D-alanine-D-alanine ligase
MPGTPVTVGMLELPGGVVVFPPLATITDSETAFYDAESKLDADRSGRVSAVAADLHPAVAAALGRHARLLWSTLGCHGAVRVDFVVSPEGRPWALEINTTPGMSWQSNLAAGARLCGLDLPDIALAMLHEAMTRPAYDVPLPVPLLRAANSPTSSEHAA